MTFNFLVTPTAEFFRNIFLVQDNYCVVSYNIIYDISFNRCFKVSATMADTFFFLRTLKTSFKNCLFFCT